MCVDILQDADLAHDGIGLGLGYAHVRIGLDHDPTGIEGNDRNATITVHAENHKLPDNQIQRQTALLDMIETACVIAREQLNRAVIVIGGRPSQLLTDMLTSGEGVPLQSDEARLTAQITEATNHSTALRSVLVICKDY